MLKTYRPVGFLDSMDIMAKKDTKNHIIKCAITLFLEHGYDHVSLNQIASKAEITKGGIYHYFGSKKELFFEVINQFSIASQKWWMTSVHEQDSFDSIKTVVKEVFDSLEEVPNIFDELTDGLSGAKRGYFTLILDGIRRFPELIEQREKRVAQSKLAQKARSAFENSQKNEEVRDGLSFDSFYFMLSASVEGALLMSMLNPKVNLDQYGKEMFDIFWNGIARQE